MAPNALAQPSAHETRLPRAVPAQDNDLTWQPAWRLRELIAARKLSPVELTEHFLARIARLDPQLHAFRQIDAAGARAQAKRAEAAVMAGEPLGLLHGIPVAIKEFLAIAGMSWRNLSIGADVIASRDSLEAGRLREAGAILVGPPVAGLVVREFGDSDRMPSINKGFGDPFCYGLPGAIYAILRRIDRPKPKNVQPPVQCHCR